MKKSKVITIVGVSVDELTADFLKRVINNKHKVKLNVPEKNCLELGFIAGLRVAAELIKSSI